MEITAVVWRLLRRRGDACWRRGGARGTVNVPLLPGYARGGRGEPREREQERDGKSETGAADERAAGHEEQEEEH